MRQDGDIGSMDYDQAVKNGEIFFGWSAWMEQDGYAPGESIAFDFENGSETYTYQGKDCRILCKRGHLSCHSGRCIPFHESEGEQPMAICGWTVIKKMLHLWNRV